MISIYKALESNFNHNGYGIIKTIKAEITEELNGMYEIEIIITIKDNEKLISHIKEYNLIKAPTPDNYQLFRIYRVDKKLHTISIYGRHIFYDNLFDYVEKISLLNTSGKNSIEAIFKNRKLNFPFKIYSDIYNTQDFILSDFNPVYGILGDEGLVSIYGGEIKRDNYNIHYLQNIGKNKGVEIRYGKNLRGLDISVDISSIITHIRPIGKNNDDTPLYLPEGYIISDNADIYPFHSYAPLYCRDIKVTKNLSTTEARRIMRERGNLLLKTGIDLPKVSGKIDFIILKETEEYKDYKLLEEISIGDIVSVEYEKLGILLKSKCIKYKYDAIKKRYINIELGSFREGFANKTGEIISKLSQNIYQIAPANISDLVERINKHKHNETDGTLKIDYNDLVNTPE